LLSGSVGEDATVELNVCTYAVGHFVFQVVAGITSNVLQFEPQDKFDTLSVPFWPAIPSEGKRWPPSDVLRGKADFDRYAVRWGTIGSVQWTRRTPGKG
jgi:hypothetical protein